MLYLRGCQHHPWPMYLDPQHHLRGCQHHPALLSHDPMHHVRGWQDQQHKHPTGKLMLQPYHLRQCNPNHQQGNTFLFNQYQDRRKEIPVLLGSNYNSCLRVQNIPWVYPLHQSVILKRIPCQQQDKHIVTRFLLGSNNKICLRVIEQL